MVQFLVAVLLLTFGLTACGSGTTGDSGAVTPQGTIDLANLKVSVPEKILSPAPVERLSTFPELKTQGVEATWPSAGMEVVSDSRLSILKIRSPKSRPWRQ